MSSKVSLETYGCQTPVFVREILETAVSSHDSTLPTFDFNELAWCWVISGRNALVWNFKSSQVSCYTLTLPQSGLKHNTDLFYVFEGNSSESCPSCLNVSPEGVIRFWPKLDRSSAYIEHVIELSGQVCQSLTKLNDTNGFVLATSTCNLFLLYPPQERSNVVNVIPLKNSQGVVAGIGRRFSSLIFSSASSQDINLIGVRVIADKKQGGNYVILLTTKFIQCFKVLHPPGNYKFLWECDAYKIATDAALREIWNLKDYQAIAQHRPAVKLSFVDIIVYDRRIWILLAVTNRAASSFVHYAIVTCSRFDTVLQDFDQFSRLSFRLQGDAQDESERAYNFKLRVMHGTTNIFLVGNDEFFLLDQEGDCQNIDLRNDKILGSGSYTTHVLLFTLKNGLNCIKFGEKFTPLFKEETSTLHQLSQVENEIDDLKNSSDRYKRFKAAFISFLKQQLPESESLLEELFISELRNDLNELVLQLSVDIIDDYPAADARWASSVPSSSVGKLGVGSNSLLLMYQLEDKRKTLNLFWEFLKRMNLWKQLAFCQSDDERRLTTHCLLFEHAEKLQACLAVVEKGWTKISSFMKESVFLSVLRRRKEHMTTDLTAQDVFFRRVSQCEQLVLTLVEEECSEIIGINQSSDRVDLISNINDLILCFMTSVQKLRQKLFDLSSLTFEYIPWTLVESFKAALIKQHATTSDYVNEAADVRRVDLLAVQLKELTDCLLFDEEIRLTILKNVQSPNYDDQWRQYESRRTKLIEPLSKMIIIFLNQYEKAIELGEKYKDYEILIRVCEATDDTSLLEAYKIKFAEYGFPIFLYNWHLQKGKFSKLFEQNDNSVREFLINRPDLKWIYHVKKNEFSKAADRLMDLANNETKLLSRQKTLYSLAKLNALCSEDEDSEKLLTSANEGLDLIAYHEKAPFTALKHCSLNPKTMPPLSVKDLIEVYITDEDADEWSFAKALDLLSSYLYGKLSSDDFEALKLHIWALAILKDDWDPIIASDEPLKVSKGTIFNRTVTLLLSICKGTLENLTRLLPSSSLLLNCEELEKLSQNVVFQYVLNAGEEELKEYLRSLPEEIVMVDIK